MSLSLTLAILWVFASTIVAFLPMERQYRPGLLLLVAAPLLIVALGRDFGWIAGMAAMAGFVSMYRNPLKYLWAKVMGTQREEAAE